MDQGQTLVATFLDDLGIRYREGGATGADLDWSLSVSFGGTTHVTVAHDTEFPRRIEVMSDLAISDGHQQAYARLPKPERDLLDRRIIQALLRRSRISFQLIRDEKGALTKVAMRAYLALEGLTPNELIHTVYDARNTTMDLCVVFQEGLGLGDGVALDRALTDPGYANVILHKGTLETLGTFQIPGETLDETILRAVRE